MGEDWHVIKLGCQISTNVDAKYTLLKTQEVTEGGLQACNGWPEKIGNVNEKQTGKDNFYII